jgi:eukaryotic-like serine/threonine-protein kinase
VGLAPNRIQFDPERRQDIYVKTANGEGMEQVLLSDGSSPKFPESWSRDGRYLLYHIGGPLPVVQDVWVLPLFGDRKPYPFIQSPFFDGRSQFSPDGHWVAYQSAESGRSEVYIVPFPGPGGKVPISTNGGREPRWRRDNGTELFFLSGNMMMSAAIRSDARQLHVVTVQRLFDVRPPPRGAFGPYDVRADGQRFLINVGDEPSATTNVITVVVNWPALLKK